VRLDWEAAYLDGRSAARRRATVRIGRTGLEITLADTNAQMRWPYRDLRQTQGVYAGEQVRLEVDHAAGGDVVEQHRQVGRGGDGLEVLDEAAAVGLVVVRRHDQHGVHPALGRLRREVHRVGGVVRPGAGHDRRLVADLVHHHLHQPQLLRVVERRRLAGGAGHHEPVRAVIDEVAGEAADRVLAQRAARIERRHHRGQDRAEVGGGGHRADYSS